MRTSPRKRRSTNRSVRTSVISQLAGRRGKHFRMQNLLLEQGAINQTVKDGEGISGIELIQRLALHQVLHTQCLIKFAFQNHTLIHHGHHAIDNLSRRGLCTETEQNKRDLESTMHQKAGPMLKKKLKCLSTWEDGTAGEGGAPIGKAGGFRL